MEETKIQFSPAEMELICNKEFILTKNKVIEKIKSFFEELQEEMVSSSKENSFFSQNLLFSNSPKISRGENYLGLPYLVLDYPRVFQQENIFAIRTMFWWGNFYSTTLHLAGLFKQQFQAKIQNKFTFLSKENYFITINPNPWVHHFEQDNYRQINLLSEKDFMEQCGKYNHVKIARNTPIDNKNLTKDLFGSWKQLIEICSD
jgi:hypothetical protein